MTRAFRASIFCFGDRSKGLQRTLPRGPAEETVRTMSIDALDAPAKRPRPGMKSTDISNPDYFHKVVDCQWACPAHTPVPEYIRMIAAGRYSDAYMVNWN